MISVSTATTPFPAMTTAKQHEQNFFEQLSKASQSHSRRIQCLPQFHPVDQASKPLQHNRISAGHQTFPAECTKSTLQCSALLTRKKLRS